MAKLSFGVESGFKTYNVVFAGSDRSDPADQESVECKFRTLEDFFMAKTQPIFLSGTRFPMFSEARNGLK